MPSRRPVHWLPLLVLLVTPPALAQDLDGVRMPPTRIADGKLLRLNGLGLRTFSWLGIHIYVAGLYLEQPSHDAAAILDSAQTKLLEVTFVHDADADHVRRAWMTGFSQDCLPPCHLPPDEVAAFLTAVPDLHKGDSSEMLFSGGTVTISVNNKVLGTVRDPIFARTILATYIGPAPPTARLKRGLLGLGS